MTNILLANNGHDWWPIFPLLWLALFAVAAWLFVRRTRGRPPESGDPLDRARGILAERFARGELTGDEYRERLGQLG